MNPAAADLLCAGSAAGDNLHNGKDLDAAAADAGAPRTFFCPVRTRHAVPLLFCAAHPRAAFAAFTSPASASCPLLEGGTDVPERFAG